MMTCIIKVIGSTDFFIALLCASQVLLPSSHDSNSFARCLIVNLAKSGPAITFETFRFEVEDWEELGPSTETFK